jgi:hypothetical protein
MFKMFIAAVVAVALLSPVQVDAYGVRHVGYTHVGPAGVQHYGATAYRGPYSSGYGAHGSAYGPYGGAYHTGYGAAYHPGYGMTGYRYTGAAGYGGAYHYGYIR